MLEYEFSVRALYLSEGVGRGDEIQSFDYRVVIDGIKSEVRQLETSTNTLTRQLENADDELKQQFLDFLNVSFALSSLRQSFSGRVNSASRFLVFQRSNDAQSSVVVHNSTTGL